MELGHLYFIVLVLVSVNLSYCCPTLCTCSDKEVNCNRVGINTIPTDVPADTVLLNLENNHITQITKHSLSKLSHLKVLRLANNKINKIEEGSFDNLKTLMKLDLARNDISELPQELFSELVSLEILYLYHNKLENVEGLFKQLKKLEKLVLENNLIKEISNDTFKDSGKLHHLKLSGNNISRIEPGAFRSNQKLTMVALDSNPIHNVDDLLHNNLQVHYLDLENCGLSKFPKGMPWTIKYLKLSRNNITRITKADTLPYAFVSVIILEDNNLSYVEKGAFSHMGFLTDVFLIKNNLEMIPGPFPQSVRSVYLDKNKIKSIPMDSFQHGTSLTVLSLRSNQIKDIPPPSFANLLSVRELHLERNPFEKLLDNVFLFVRGLTYMSLNHLNLGTVYSDCFLGLDTMEKLELSFIGVPEGKIYGNPFLSTPNLKTLTLQESPNLARYVTENRHILDSLVNLTSINLNDNKLQTLKDTFQQALPNLQEIKLSGNHFSCDTNLIWLRQWMALEPEKFVKPHHVVCYQPQHLFGTAILDVPITNFQEPEFTNFQQPVNTTIPFDSTATTTSEYYSYDYYDDHINNYESVDPYVDPYDDYHYEYYSFNYYDTVTQGSDSLENTSLTHTPKENNSNISKERSPNIYADNGNATDKVEKTHGSNTRAVVLALSMSIGVVFIMLLIAGILYCLWRRKHHVVHDQPRQYKTTDDYVFIVSKKGNEAQPNTRKLTREERGSTTSKASEDITNSADPTMKVYMITD